MNATPSPRAAAAVVRGDNRLVGADRVLDVLRRLGDYPDGVALDELTRATASPKSTVHRALTSLRRAGFADQDSSGRYRLGSDLVRLAFDYQARRPEHLLVQPLLEELTQQFGETSHFGVLDGRWIVYVAKVDPASGPVRLTSTVGGRNPAHLTAIGKCLLSHELNTLANVREWVVGGALERRTRNSIGSAKALHAALSAVRARGFATDDQENEPGVNCLALPVWFGVGGRPSGAVSISGLAYRTPLDSLVSAASEVAARIEGFGWGSR